MQLNVQYVHTHTHVYLPKFNNVTYYYTKIKTKYIYKNFNYAFNNLNGIYLNYVLYLIVSKHLNIYSNWKYQKFQHKFKKLQIELN